MHTFTPPSRLLTAFLSFVLALLSLNAHADCNVTINIDDSSRVVIRLNYAAVSGIKTGANQITVPQYGSLQIEATSGNYLTSVVKTNTSGSVSQGITSLTSCNIYLSEPADEGAVINVLSANLDEARTASCTVNVDNASKVSLLRAGTYSRVDLTDGANTVKWIPGVETPFTVSPANYGGAPLYKVLLNGKSQPTDGTSFSVTPTDGSVIDIQAEYPDINIPVVFSFSSEEAKGAVSSVSVDGTPTTNYLDSNFTVKAGAKVSVSLDRSNYSIDNILLNGKTYTSYGNIDFYVTDTTTLSIKAHKYSTVKATITIDHPENVTVYQGYSYNNRVLTLTEGDNTVELPETDCLIQVKPNSGCKVESLTANGATITAGYDGNYTITLTDSMNVVIASSAIVRDKTATVYVDNLSLAKYGFNFTRQDRSNITLTNGTNTISFADSDNPFYLSIYGADHLSVSLNGKTVDPVYPGGSSFQLQLADGDKLDILLSEQSTGISTMEQTAKDCTIYRIDGTRINGNHLRSGVYIINGKKILVK